MSTGVLAENELAARRPTGLGALSLPESTRGNQCFAVAVRLLARLADKIGTTVRPKPAAYSCRH